MLHLSKSRYCSAVQCPKMLWLKKNKPEAFDDSVVNQAVLDRGNDVGDLAMGLFGDYVKVPFGDLSEMIRQTQTLVEAGTPIIAEASFSYDGLFCSVDILKNLGDKRVELVEVKSSTRVSDIYLHDVAYQVYVLTHLGFTVEKACLAHINSGYVRHGELDLQALFTVEDLSETVFSMQAGVVEHVQYLREYMEQTDEPETGIGGQCFAPYACGFFKYCGRALPTPSIFDVGGIQLRTKLTNYEKGIVSFPEIETSKKAVNPNGLMQVAHELHDLAPAIDREKIAQFLKGLSYPLYFLDFESFQPAVPLYDNSSPYEQIVFQYSLHYIPAPGGELLHREYLAQPGEDPRRGVAEALCRDIPVDVCTLAYNMSFEKGRIRALAALYPDLSDHLMNIHDHIVDLMAPFQKRHYYCRAMQGSYSIKYVLPALFPDDPELDYHNLEGVHNGTEASATFERMENMTPEEQTACRSNLLKYCGLDTLAMVKVWQKLTEVIGNNL